MLAKTYAGYVAPECGANEIPKDSDTALPILFLMRIVFPLILRDRFIKPQKELIVAFYGFKV